MGQGGSTSVSVVEANKLLSAGSHTYLDVRTPEEFAAGHAPGAVNIPIMLSGAAGMVKSSNFLQEVEDKFPKSTSLLIGCKAGPRAKQAISELQKAGYENAVDVTGGFLEWEKNGLTVER